MVSQGEKLQIIATKLINKFGNDVILRKYDPPTYDEWGEPNYSTYSDIQVKAVMDSEIISRLNLTSAGKLADASLSILLPSEVTPENGNTIIVNAKEYNIIEIQPVTINNVIILYQLFVAER